MKQAVLEQLLRAQIDRHAIVIVTDLATGKQWDAADPELPENAELLAAIEDGERTGKTRIVQTGGQEYFVLPQIPEPRLLLVGAVHISQALAQVARTCGFDPIVIDPRTAFANQSRFEGVRIHAEWPDVAIPEIGLDRHTAVAVLTHDPKIDDPALHLALPSDVFYVGALGSRRTHEKRVDRLLAAGRNREQIDQIDAPIGLDIAAANPQEIAVSIMAAVVRAWRSTRAGKARS